MSLRLSPTGSVLRVVGVTTSGYYESLRGLL